MGHAGARNSLTPCASPCEIVGMLELAAASGSGPNRFGPRVPLSQKVSTKLQMLRTKAIVRILVVSRTCRFDLIPQQLVDAGLGAGALVDALDDDGAARGRPGLAVLQRPARQRARHHHGIFRDL